MKLRQMSVLAAAGVMALGDASAQAVVVEITSGANAGVVVFDSGGYEASTAGALPGINDPVVGTYEFNNTIGVTAGNGAAEDGLTGANEGSNYLSIERDVSTGGDGSNANSWVNHVFSQPINPATESFKMTLAWWGTTKDMGMGLGDSSADNLSNATPGKFAAWGMDSDIDGGNPALREYETSDGIGGGDAIFNTATLTIGQWNTVVYEWDHVAGASTVTINGVTETLGIPNDAPATVTQFHVRANGPEREIYIDSVVVPEPGSLGLLLSGSVLALARGRRH